MPQEVRFITFQAQPSAIRHAIFDNKEHLVVPLIALVEGVLQAANTPNPELALASEFGAIPAAWDGRPVTLGHPKKDGKFVSANSPDVLESVKVGMLFNTHLDGDKLKTEAWLDIQKMPFNERARLTSGKEIEVSTGFFAEVEPKQGEFNGKVFLGIQRDIKPDHLAILAEGDIGACSFADGCGAPRLNKDDAESTLPEGVRLSEDGGGGCSNGGQCSCGGQSRTNSLSTARHTKEKGNSMNNVPNTKANVFQKALTTLISAFETFTSDTQEEPMDKEALVAGIVDADSSKYSQEDKKRLLGLPEDILMDLSRFFTKHGSDEDEEEKRKEAAKVAEAAKIAEDAKANAAKPKNGNANAAPANENEDDDGDDDGDGAPMSVDQYIADQLKDAPREVRDMINAGVDKIREERVLMLKGLKATKRCAFSDKELEAMDTHALENMVKLANVPDYSGAGGPHANVEEDENAAPEPLLVFEKTA